MIAQLTTPDVQGSAGMVGQTLTAHSEHPVYIVNDTNIARDIVVRVTLQVSGHPSSHRKSVPLPYTLQPGDILDTTFTLDISIDGGFDKPGRYVASGLTEYWGDVYKITMPPGVAFVTVTSAGFALTKRDLSKEKGLTEEQLNAYMKRQWQP
jgi:hypothetical protein